MTETADHKETALHRLADSILILDSTVRRLATDVQALARDIGAIGDRRDRDLAHLQADLARISRDIDDLAKQVNKARSEIEENSGPHLKADAEWDRPDPSVVVRGRYKLTTEHLVTVAKAALLTAAGAALKLIYDYGTR